MQATCRYSGLSFRTEYFPFTFKNSTQHHPVFDIPFPDLLNLSNDWLSDRYTLIDRRLIFLALLKSTDLIQFRTYARPTDSTIAANMDAAIEWAGFIHGLKSPEQLACLPRFIITSDTASLITIDGWFDTWRDAIAEYKDNYRSYNAAQMQVRREDALARVIKDENKHIESYARSLAEWASIAASFPTGLVPNPFASGESISLSAYWQDIIRKCASRTYQIWRLNRTDLDELIEHLEFNLPHGTIVAHEVMHLVRTAAARHDSALGLATIDSPAFTLLDENDNVEKANILAAAAQAPSVKPKPEDYPTRAGFVLARARWNLAQKVGAANNAAKEMGL